MNELIIKIGPLFWVLSVLAVYALAVVAERILYFHRIQINTGDFLRGISKPGMRLPFYRDLRPAWFLPCWRMPD